MAFLTQRAPVALLISILAAEMFLPVGLNFKVKGVPDLDRGRIAVLFAFVACLAFQPQALKVKGKAALLLVPLLLVTIASVATAFTNRDTVAWGSLVLPGLNAHDAASLVVADMLDYGIPFLLALLVFRRRADLVLLLRTLSLAGLVYSVFILIELRMSPQFHIWVYGYLPTQFLQHIRNGGYRPIVFMNHGLAVSMFIMSTTLASLGLRRARVQILGFDATPIAAYLFVILVLCKSWAPVVYGLLGVALLLFASERLQRGVAWGAVLFLLAYPALRTLDWIPTQAILSIAGSASEDRAASLEWRFDNEKMLLEHAWQRIWFGWGSWGRDRVYNSDGGDISTQDGLWIIELGRGGALGFLAHFSLILLPMALFRRNVGRIGSKRTRQMLTTLALIQGFRAIDFVPNSGFTPEVVLLYGALAGLALDLPNEERALRQRAAREVGVPLQGPRTVVPSPPAPEQPEGALS
jgi:hypothetical protein